MQNVKDFDSSDFNSSDNGAPDFTLADLSILKVMFCELEEILDKIVTEHSGNNAVKPGDYIIDVSNNHQFFYKLLADTAAICIGKNVCTIIGNIRNK